MGPKNMYSSSIKKKKRKRKKKKEVDWGIVLFSIKRYKRRRNYSEKLSILNEIWLAVLGQYFSRPGTNTNMMVASFINNTFQMNIN